MLRTFTIRTSNGAPIIEAKIRKTNRDVVHVALDESKCAAGEVGIIWNILERNDAVIIQLIYQGDESNVIVADAVVTGQPNIFRPQYSREIRSPSREYEQLQFVGRWLPIFSIAFGILVIPLRAYPNNPAALNAMSAQAK